MPEQEITTGLYTRSEVVNAAGLWSDEVARLAGDHSFTLTPRKQKSGRF